VSGIPSVIVSSKTPTIIDRLSVRDWLALALVARADVPPTTTSVTNAIRIVRLDM
jgi:hypothetical protein